MSRATPVKSAPRVPAPKNKQFQNLSGNRYGRLLVKSYAGIRPRKGESYGRHLWFCQCDCGKKIITTGENLKSGNTTSCGCAHSEWVIKNKTRHGHTRGKHSREYNSHQSMKSRCYNPKNIGYHLYGGRGITVCDRWLTGSGDKTGFECFLEDMGVKPTPKHSIDRIDVNGNYDPNNCRWATTEQQVCNTRRNRWVTFQGRKMTITQAIRESGVRKDLVYQRLKRGKSMEHALKNIDYRNLLS